MHATGFSRGLSFHLPGLIPKKKIFRCAGRKKYKFKIQNSKFKIQNSKKMPRLANTSQHLNGDEIRVVVGVVAHVAIDEADDTVAARSRRCGRPVDAIIVPAGWCSVIT